MSVADQFRKFAGKVSVAAGSPTAFTFSIVIIIVWACLGPGFQYSDTWQLVINTGTTIITFLMVFLIQNTQNRDAKSTHLKLDELIRATKHARNSLIDLDSLSDVELDHLHKELCTLNEETEEKIQKVVQTRESKSKKSHHSSIRNSSNHNSTNQKPE
jgi:low affinity Fe/Cu permease